MKPNEFRERLLTHQRPTRELILEPGDPGPVPLTKVGGIPWWPATRPRPRCRGGDAMSFVFQVRLSDVPGLAECRELLLSFHYCLECSYSGNMSWGWEDPGSAAGYDVAVLPVARDTQVDGVGVIAEAIVEPYTLRFRDVLETPKPEELDIYGPELPDDYPQGADDFDENIYPGLIHVARSKIGGWPTWVQNNAWPPAKNNGDVRFVGQLDWMSCPRAPWCAGGYVYLFVLIADGEPIAGQMALQTT